MKWHSVKRVWMLEDVCRSGVSEPDMEFQTIMIYCEVNTNRHMFVYMINPSMVYIRAAARSNNKGTLFFRTFA